MTRSTYVETLIAVCPEHNGVIPGHVHKVEEAGVYGWTCPKCDTSFEPTELPEEFGVVDVEDAEQDRCSHDGKTYLDEAGFEYCSECDGLIPAEPVEE